MARGLWSGAISFGLLNIPVSIVGAKGEERIHFNMLDKRDHARIGYKQINKSTGREVSRKDIVKGYEFKKNKFVIVEAEDFKKANPKATQTIDIEDFVDLEDLDFMLFEKPYYLVPGKNGMKGYVLLREVLQDTRKVAIGRFVLRNKQHLVSIIPKGSYLILELLRFSHEIEELHEADVLDEDELEKVKVSPRELTMAKELVAGMTSKWKPDKYKDTYQEDLLKLINKKIKSGKTQDVEPAQLSEPSEKDVGDMMALLQKSLKLKKQKGPKSHQVH
jgi:DNA end-binding protein Ku